jgi:hypothetical protein
MSLEDYFLALISRVENSIEIKNDGKDKNGFYLPTRTLILRHLNLLYDLHSKPMAKDRVKDSWQFIVEKLPPEWLILTDSQREELKKILK